MLVLTRKNDESVLIQVAGETIEVVLVKSNEARSRIGFKAPQKARIVRKEIANKIPGVADPAPC